MVHDVKPERRTLHGCYSATLEPAVNVRSGDVLRCTTLDVSWSDKRRDASGHRPTFGPRESPRDDGPALLGPIVIEEARRGMVVDVHLRAIVPASHGWTYAGELGPLNRDVAHSLGVGGQPPLLLRWEFDRDGTSAVSDSGHRVTLRPFLGMLGTCPAVTGEWADGWTPRVCGGNLDCRELVAGSVVTLPVEVDGAFLSLGDGHASQGDGEVGGSAIECAMERVEMQVVARMPTPRESRSMRVRALSPAGIVSFGFAESLDGAAADAINDMLDLVMETHAVSRHEALGLVSVAGHVRVTQIANGVRGVHVLLPHGAIGPTGEVSRMPS